MFAAALLILASCGAEPAALSIAITRSDALLFTPETIEIRVYGEGASCTNLTADYDTLDHFRCSATETETGTCFIEERAGLAYQPGTASDPIAVSVGSRRVNVRGHHSIYGVVAVGCTSVEIEEGKTASARITLIGPI
jgi:hypothetical protein